MPPSSGQPPGSQDPLAGPSRLSPEEAIAKRAPRYALVLQVWFASPDGLAMGYTVDMSASGMLVDFEHPLEVWLVGELTMYAHSHPVKLIARVIRTEGRRTALTFRIRGDHDREAIEELMVVAEEQGQFVAPTP